MSAQTPPRDPTLHPQQPPGYLCDRCRSINFDEIFSERYEHDEIFALMSLKRPPPGDCALCQLFAEYCGDDLERGLLCSVPWPDTSEEDSERPNFGRLTSMLCILPTLKIHNRLELICNKGYIMDPANVPSHWRHEAGASCSLDPGNIDYSMIRSWLTFCQTRHRYTPECLPPEVESEWRIRFIDCETRLVIEAASLGSNCPPFLALSYVWGQPVDLKYRQPAHDEPLEDLPQTIKDSIIVTKKLGFRYLWVDKYCIRQDDEQDKRRQIRLMAEIYGSAQITIVAVAGSDPSYGLPGVSQPRRIGQRQARVGNRTLMWVFGSNSFRDMVRSSIWSTRGWTYQEAILSTRRLVFTDQQVHFQCGESAFYETFNVPLELRVPSDYGRRQPTPTDTLFPRMGDLSHDWAIGDRIHEYTRRKLGNEADILNAFQGVLSVFAKQYGLFSNVWGVPIVAYGGWSSTHKLLASVCWTLEMPGERRDGFPSWSWIGWKGVVNSTYAKDILRASAYNAKDITISFELPNGTRMEWSQLEPTLGADGSQDHPRILVLDCYSFVLPFERVCSGFDADGAASMGSPGKDAKPKPEVVGDAAGHFHPLCKRLNWGADQPQEGQFRGVPLDLWRTQYTSSASLFILVFHKKTEFWERIGHFEWSNPGGLTDFRTFSNTVPTTRTVLRIA